MMVEKTYEVDHLDALDLDGCDTVQNLIVMVVTPELQIMLTKLFALILSKG